MSVNVKKMDSTPEQVFAVLADPWIYPTWVVGASRLRAADGGYPEAGTKLHHSIGVWPLVLNDETEVEEYDPPRKLVLQAKTRPFGSERVIIEVRPHGSGSLVRMEEYTISGPAQRIPRLIADAILFVRNAETLRRLGFASKGRAQQDANASSGSAAR
jgi:hypothetical protein